MLESSPSRSTITSARRIVIKIGSGVLSSEGALEAAAIDRLAAQVHAARARGIEVVLVSSGAVACGLSALNLSWPVGTVVDQQAAAAVGQPALVSAWTTALASHGHTAAQVLLSAADLGDRERFLNARRAIERLLAGAVVPIVNENDSVATDELRFGDNDRLSALVADLIDADALVILTKTEGLLDAEGRTVPQIHDLERARALVRTDRSSTGVGGMATKIEAVGIAHRAAVHALIASGTQESVLERILDGQTVGTWFEAADRSERARKRWLWSSASLRGTLTIDAGAEKALVQRGASLLPVGVTAVEGEFDAGSVVRLVGPEGEIGRGLCAYSSSDARLILGKPAAELRGILGSVYSEELVHRDDLVLTKGSAR